MPELLIAAFWLWVAGLTCALLRLRVLASGLTAIGAVLAIGAIASTLPQGSGVLDLPIALAGEPVRVHYTPEALWLMGFGLLPAFLAVALGSPIGGERGGWLVGAALSLLGALGVFGLQDGYSFLIAWELMSLGGAVMLLSERASPATDRSTLYMLSMLEVGAVAILLALLLIARAAGGAIGFGALGTAAAALPSGVRFLVGLSLLVGFGAKLGLLPFYEWFPGAYASGSGATGAIMSGVVLNAAFFGLSRGLIDWLPSSGAFGLGVLVTVVGVLSSILAVLYAFQQDDWRRLLSFSSAENAAIAVTGVGAALLFRADRQDSLAALAWTVAVLHLSGHALAKGGLFLCADGLYVAGGTYRLAQHGWLRASSSIFGIGALFAAMSLAAMPPQIGFATEWFTFQVVFQGFHLATLTGRLTLSLAGAGLALTAAVAFATFVKAFGIGLLGSGAGQRRPPVSIAHDLAVLILGVAVLGAAVGLPVWLRGLSVADLAQFGADAAQAMHSGWLLVPLTDRFAFISPSKLVIVMPLLSILPLLLLLNARGHAVRRVPVWYGGFREDPQRAATTTLTFANAMRTFYSFIYRPTLDTAREHRAVAYFIRKLEFEHDIADVFGPLLFTPIRRIVWNLAGWLRALQSGDLNLYVALIGGLLVMILALTLR
ncbi:MAG TPA: proton-conducting transporter membrane subunit [Steroidobacteraceae bacterium]|nr:proton-conducting transporter membrane subunit [Steroidobacteraceae bacterium]